MFLLFYLCSAFHFWNLLAKPTILISLKCVENCSLETNLRTIESLLISYLPVRRDPFLTHNIEYLMFSVFLNEVFQMYENIQHNIYIFVLTTGLRNKTSIDRIEASTAVFHLLLPPCLLLYWGLNYGWL